MNHIRLIPEDKDYRNEPLTMNKAYSLGQLSSTNI